MDSVRAVLCAQPKHDRAVLPLHGIEMVDSFEMSVRVLCFKPVHTGDVGAVIEPQLCIVTQKRCGFHRVSRIE
jgi:hypothetical protein